MRVSGGSLSFSAGTSTRANPCGPEVNEPPRAVSGRGDGDEVGRRRLDRQQPRAGEGGERKMAVAIGPHGVVELVAVSVVGVARLGLIHDAGTGDRPPRAGLDDPAAEDAAFRQGEVDLQHLRPGGPALVPLLDGDISRIRGRGKP